MPQTNARKTNDDDGRVVGGWGDADDNRSEERSRSLKGLVNVRRTEYVIKFVLNGINPDTSELFTIKSRLTHGTV